jgi:hypothetical protein
MRRLERMATDAERLAGALAAAQLPSNGPGGATGSAADIGPLAARLDRMSDVVEEVLRVTLPLSAKLDRMPGAFTGGPSSAPGSDQAAWRKAGR